MKVILEHGKQYDLGATMATYDAHTDTFKGGNWFVHRCETVYKNATVDTWNWYKLVRNGKITVWQSNTIPTIWGALDYRLYQYYPELQAGKYNWVQISGRL